MKKVISVYVFVGILCCQCVATVSDDLLLELKEGERLAIPLWSNQLLCIGSDSEVAIILIENLEGKAARYRIRHFNKKTRVETVLSGNLAEKYTRIQREDGDFDLEDDGSLLQIVAGGISLEWSYGGKNNCYLYPLSQEFTYTLMHREYYSKLSFRDAK